MILSVYLPAVLLALAKGMFLPVLPLWLKSLGIPLWLIGVVLAAEAFGTLLSDLPVGQLLQRLSRRRVMLLGVGVLGGSSLLLILSTTALAIIALRLLAGLGTALWDTSRHAFLAEITSKQNRGRTLALFGGTKRLGTFLGPLLGGVLAAQLGFASVFWAYGLLCAISLVICAVAIRTEDEGAVSRQAPAAITQVFSANRHIFATAGAGQIFAQMIRAGRQVLIPLYAAFALGMDVDSVGLIIGIANFVDMSLFYPAGWLMDRFGRKFATVPTFFLQALGMLLLPLSSGFYGLLAVSVVMAIGNGFSAGSMMTLGADFAPKESLGTFLGIWRLIGDIGFSVAPITVGLMANSFGLGASALSLACVGFTASYIFARHVPETLVEHY